MKTLSLVLLMFLISLSTLAEEGPFLLGEDNDSWGLVVSPGADSLQMKVGGRLQTVLSQSFQKDVSSGRTLSFQDFYLRRVRFQFEAKYKNGIKYYMDVRNDNPNRLDSGESDFNIGDAYIGVPDVFGIQGLSFRAFRAKVDVSRSETISSSRLLFLDRASIADEAAQFVSHNRRASNIQLLGTFDRWAFQLVTGDGIQSGAFDSATGSSLSGGSIDRQRLMFGGKVRFYPLTGWGDKKPSETYFAQGKHISVGAGVFTLGGIEYQNSSGSQVETLDRSLVNIEFSFHYKNLSFQSEFFRFNGVVESFSTSSKNRGTSDGYYGQLEYVFPSLSYIAPFVRYESWDRFREKTDYDQTSSVGGINWYLKGNKIRLALAFEHLHRDSNLRSADSRGRVFSDDRNIKLTSMWHF